MTCRSKYLFFSPGGPIPHNMAKTFDGPPTLERSGSERRGGAVSSLFPEGERVGVKGGAFLNGKEPYIQGNTEIDCLPSFLIFYSWIYHQYSIPSILLVVTLIGVFYIVFYLLDKYQIKVH